MVRGAHRRVEQIFDLPARRPLVAHFGDHPPRADGL
jgi:hypothetical protein